MTYSVNNELSSKVRKELEILLLLFEFDHIDRPVHSTLELLLDAVKKYQQKTTSCAASQPEVQTKITVHG